MTSLANPVLADGASYWIVVEPTTIPAGPTVNIDSRWFSNTSGTTTLFRQQQAFGVGVLVSDPWSGFAGQGDAAFLVEGTPAAATGGAIPTLSEYGVALFALLLAGAAVLVIRKIAV